MVSLIQRSVPLRLAGPSDVGTLMALAAADNPFMAKEEILDRAVITDRIGLLVGDRAPVTTLLYLWTHTIDDVLPWMAHAASWLERYPAWRKAHGLPPSADPVRVVLAAPEIGESVRSAVRLVVWQVTLVRYVYVELGGQPILGWEWGAETSEATIQGGVRTDLPAGERPWPSVPDELTPEELAFFQRL